MLTPPKHHFADILDGFFYGLNYGDFAIPLGLFLWSLTLLLSLKKIDCSHSITAATYTCFYMATGILLVLAIPAKEVQTPSLQFTLLLAFLFAFLASLKWRRALQNQKAKLTYLKSNATRSEPDAKQ